MYSVMKKETYELLMKYLQTKPWGEVNATIVPLLTQVHQFEDLPDAIKAPFLVGQIPLPKAEQTAPKEEGQTINIDEGKKKKK